MIDIFGLRHLVSVRWEKGKNIFEQRNFEVTFTYKSQGVQRLKSKEALHCDRKTLPNAVPCLSHNTILRSCYCYLNGPYLAATSGRL